MDDETELGEPAQVEGLEARVMGFAPIERTGMPPGNPNSTVGPGEGDLRRAETAALGKAEAARRAWTRFEARPGAKAGPKKAPGASGARKPVRPSNATSLGDNVHEFPAGSARSSAKGKDRKEIERWSKGVQLAYGLIAMKLQDQDWAISDEEAVFLTEPFMDVMEHYNIKMKGTAGVWGAMIYALGMVNGPRIVTTVMRVMAQRKAEEAAAQAPKPQFDFANVGNA